MAANHGVLASAVYDQRGALIARRGRDWSPNPLIVAATHARVVTSAQGGWGLLRRSDCATPAALMLDQWVRRTKRRGSRGPWAGSIELDGQAFEAAQRVFIATVLLIMAGLLILIAVPSGSVNPRDQRTARAPGRRGAPNGRRRCRGADSGRGVESQELTGAEQGFNSMANSIAESQRTLQRKVEEATDCSPIGRA